LPALCLAVTRELMTLYAEVWTKALSGASAANRSRKPLSDYFNNNQAKIVSTLVNQTQK